MHLMMWSVALLIVVAVVVAVVTKPSRTHIPNNPITRVEVDDLGQAFVLHALPHRAADHTTADAVVRVPDSFDATEPIHLIVYNHGFYTNVEDGYRDMRLAEQMTNAPPNSILFLPEWQKRPSAASSDQGLFKQKGVFAGMVQDAFDRIPALKGMTLDQVNSISILSHSAGYNPAETMLYRNGIESKIVNVTLLDALYDHDGFNQWLEDNIQSVADGQKRFYNIFYGTSKYSKDQAAYIKRLLSNAGLPATIVYEDYNSGETVMTAPEFAQHSVVFKYSSKRVDDLEPHFSIPNLYVEPVVHSEKR
ncbi:MAG TPA: hypothetical protein V6D22_08230 [Candidatus Obscuribacterales bacterium]